MKGEKEQASQVRRKMVDASDCPQDRIDWARDLLD